FRLAPGGAQELYGVQADLTTLGKIIGGGLPVGAYGGKKEIMDFVSPSGPVYQAGTLSGNPLAMTAGITMLKILKEQPTIYEELNKTTSTLVDAIQQDLQQLDMNYTINQVGSMMSLFFTSQEVTNFKTASSSQTETFSRYFQSMLAAGIYLPPSQYESWFISRAITPEITTKIIEANRLSLQALKG
ncbi:MAG: aminotransferase class III-fold pyridoxal phosphate-dependent enzyme, partial [Cyclobacteriaceae bacterium]|nr:aminotransferase class III-fold pyridoxal phosphate-dependent enzyme [Cyclobacteriaceae bacterium]